MDERTQWLWGLWGISVWVFVKIITFFKKIFGIKTVGMQQLDGSDSDEDKPE